jgi:hypothetical protein
MLLKKVLNGETFLFRGRRGDGDIYVLKFCYANLSRPVAVFEKHGEFYLHLSLTQIGGQKESICPLYEWHIPRSHHRDETLEQNAQVFIRELASNAGPANLPGVFGLSKF